MQIRNPFRKAKKSHKTILAVLLVPLAVVWDKLTNLTRRKRITGWRRIFG